MRLLVSALFVLAFASLHTVRARADACECPMQSQVDAIAASAAVFEGHVLRVSPAVVEEGVPTATVELSVVRTWKGAQQERVTLRTPGASEACGVSFARGESYVVYATEHAESLWVVRCGRTRLIAEASADLKTLGLGVTPVEPRNEAKQPRAEPPARGGCAGCNVGAADERRRDPATAYSLAMLAGFALACRLRARRGRREQT